MARTLPEPSNPCGRRTTQRSGAHQAGAREKVTECPGSTRGSVPHVSTQSREAPRPLHRGSLSWSPPRAVRWPAKACAACHVKLPLMEHRVLQWHTSTKGVPHANPESTH